MTERLADVTARIEGIRQLGTVVNAMRGLAGARAQAARNQLAAVESYAAILATVVARGFALIPEGQTPSRQPTRPAVVLFCAEQGFAGAFSEHVLDKIDSATEIFLIGTRGAQTAAERGIKPLWSSPMPATSSGIPALADRIATAIYDRIAAQELDSLDAIFARPYPAQGVHIERRRLFPLNPAAFPPENGQNPPLLNLAPQVLLREVAADYVHAELTQAALLSFAAESEARMEAMAAAHRHIEHQLQALELTRQLVRQEEITAEIIELAAGANQADCGQKP
jgi:F-type H+-transporting ATPase subunit gamma